MATENERLRQLPSAVWDPLERILHDFEQAWRQGRRPIPEAYLPPGPTPIALLVELVHLDLEYRLKAGEEARVEDYLARHPELAQDREAALDLIAAEYRLRRCREANLSPEVYGRRFPQYRAELPSLLQDGQRPTEVLPQPGPTPGPVPSAPGSAEAGRPTIPGYEIHHELARGGMGVILRGRDPDLGRDLAVKVLRPEHQADPALVQRFLEEAQIGGQLQHPGIVPVYALGRAPDQRPYFTMKLIRGQTLAALLQARSDPRADLPRFLGIFLQVCQTLAYAHSRGVIHRDLKPANVMVGAFGEVQAMDWGLAKVLKPGQAAGQPARPEGNGGGPLHTVRSGTPGQASEAGAVLGTPAYMAPEQARGEVEHLDERCDVFGLGAILCEILTGQPPFAAPDGRAALLKAARGELADARERLERCGADGELVRLAEACLAAEPEQRPRDAAAVAEAVTAYQASVEQRLRAAELAGAEARARAAQERRARRLTVALAATVLLAVLGGGGGWLWWQRQQEARRDETRRAIDLALGRADQLADQARKAGRTEAGMQSAVAFWEQALGAVEQAAGVAAAGVADAATRQQVGSLWQQVEGELAQARKDARLLGDLDRAWLAQATDGTGGLDAAATKRGYEAALREYGVTVGERDPKALAAQLRTCSPVVLPQVVLALDHWALWGGPGPLRGSWLQAAQEVDPDPWCGRLRSAIADRDVPVLRQLAEEARRKPIPAVGVVLLALALHQGGASEEAVALLRQAQRTHPADFWVHFDLATILNGTRDREKGRLEEAIGCYRIALALRPQSAAVYHNLGLALKTRGDLDGAIAEFQKAIEVSPDYARAHHNLGVALYARRDVRGAITEIKKAVALDPKDSLAHHDLGVVLAAKGDLDGAIAMYRKAVALDPKFARAHSGLGDALRLRRDVEGAIPELREAIRLDPKDAEAHNILGVALKDKGDLVGAAAAFRRAIELDPKAPRPHNNLGNILKDQRDLDGAVAAFQKAIQINPRYAEAHYNLGNTLKARGDLAGAAARYLEAIRLNPSYARAYNNLADVLQAQGDWAGAIAAYRKAIAIDPNYAMAHCNLGIALRAQGQFTAALQAIQRGHELGSSRTGWRLRSAEWLEEAKRLAALEPRLPDFLTGAARPADAQEALALAEWCRVRKSYAAAARFAAEAFAANPTLADDLQSLQRYNAACATASAAAGAGTDAAHLSDQEQARLRKQALEWLRADLAAWGKLADRPEVRPVLRRVLGHWQTNAELATLRDPVALAKLPEREHAAWQQLWSEIAALLERTNP
jgi:tetratricopeptide (TPR) repeat protein